MTDLVSNGLDGINGGYLLPPQDLEELAALLTSRGEGDRDREHALESRRAQADADLGAVYGTDIDDLTAAGWAVVFAPGTSADVREALTPLLELRRGEAGRRFVEVSDETAVSYHGQSKADFLAEFGAPPSGPVEPDRFPYYVLLVGEPEDLPYTFQSDMGIQHAVGRLCFDEVDDYRRYGDAVVTAEASPDVDQSLRLVAAHHDDDGATALSQEYLAKPIVEATQKWFGRDNVVSTIGPAADHAAFCDAFSGPESVVFTAGHGMGMPLDHPQQRQIQGALVTSTLTSIHEPISSDCYVDAADMADATPGGKVCFTFGCFTSGTPSLDAFSALGAESVRIADSPFVAALPQALLGHRNGPALAVVGHVDRAWGCSFIAPGRIDQTGPYRACLRAVLDGRRVGYALEGFAQLYADCAVSFSNMVRQADMGLLPKSAEIASQWIATADAGAFVVNGDPAVRLKIGVSP